MQRFFYRMPSRSEFLTRAAHRAVKLYQPYLIPLFHLEKSKWKSGRKSLRNTSDCNCPGVRSAKIEDGIEKKVTNRNKRTCISDWKLMIISIYSAKWQYFYKVIMWDCYEMVYFFQKKSFFLKIDEKSTKKKKKTVHSSSVQYCSMYSTVGWFIFGCYTVACCKTNEFWLPSRILLVMIQ